MCIRDRNDHIYSSAALKKNINARSLKMRMRIFQPQCYVPFAVLRVGYAEVIFIQPDGKLGTMWRDAWQRLASSYPTSRWDVAVNLMVTAAERCSLLPLTPPETQKLAAWEPAVHFVHRIARIWTRLTAIWGGLEQTVYHHQSFSSDDKIKRAIVKSMVETTA